MFTSLSNKHSAASNTMYHLYMLCTSSMTQSLSFNFKMTIWKILIRLNFRQRIFRVMLLRAIILFSTNCPFDQTSLRPNVPSTKWHSNKRNCTKFHSTKCHRFHKGFRTFGRMTFVQMLFGWCYIWSNGRSVEWLEHFAKRLFRNGWSNFFSIQQIWNQTRFFAQ